MSQNEDPMFQAACDMGGDIDTIKTWAVNIMMLTGECTMDDALARVLSQIAQEINDRVAALMKSRQVIWRAVHPRRLEFERDGWPDDVTKAVA